MLLQLLQTLRTQDWPRRIYEEEEEEEEEEEKGGEEEEGEEAEEHAAGRVLLCVSASNAHVQAFSASRKKTPRSIGILGIVRLIGLGGRLGLLGLLELSGKLLCL